VKDKDTLEEQTLEAYLGTYNEIYQSAVKIRSRYKTIDILIIVISSLTSGSLWALIGTSYKTVFAWSAAILSTTLTIITLLQKNLKLENKYDELIGLYGRVGQEIALLRTLQPNDENQALAWFKLKRFREEMGRILR
jgi:hypothetical protein